MERPAGGGLGLVAAAVERFWAFALIGIAIYLGSISTSDFPSTGSVYDVATWDINKTTTNAAGDVTATASAVGAFSNKQNLTYA